MQVRLVLEFQVESNSDTIPFDQKKAVQTLSRDIFNLLAESCDADPYGAGSDTEDGFSAQLDYVDVMPENESAIQDIVDAAHNIVVDFDNYGEVLQTDESGNYGPESSLGQLRTALEKLNG